MMIFDKKIKYYRKKTNLFQSITSKNGSTTWLTATIGIQPAARASIKDTSINLGPGSIKQNTLSYNK